MLILASDLADYLIIILFVSVMELGHQGFHQSKVQSHPNQFPHHPVLHIY